MAVSLEPMTKVSEGLREMLNKAIAREIQVSIQYMWQHVQVMGVKAVAVQDKFKTTAIAEMKQVVDALTAAGIRDKVKVIVGGAPVTQSWAKEIGADGYSEDAVGAVVLAKQLLGVTE